MTARAAGIAGLRPSRLMVAALFAAAALSSGLLSASASAASPGQWVVLDSGRLGDYAWTVKTKRLRGPGEAGTQGAERPCLLIGTKWELSPYSFRRGRYRHCADAPGPLVATAPPLIASGVVPTSGPRPKLTAVGMIVAPAVRSVRVTLEDGDSMTVRAERLSARLQRSTGLSRARYAAFPVRGGWCPDRVVSRSATGRVLWDSDTDDAPCSAAAAAG